MQTLQHFKKGDKMKEPKKPEPVKFTLYLPGDLNEQIEFIRYKERLNKNTVVIEALKKYLPDQIKKYPEYKKVKSV